MKNNLIIIIISFIFFNNYALAETFKFNTKTIEIVDNGNQINAGEGKAFSSDNSLEINATKFKYTKNLGKLVATGSGSLLVKSKNLEIEFDNAIFDQKNSQIEMNGNVKIYHIDRTFYIETNEVTYNQNDNLISSLTKTSLEDSFKNTYIVDSFFYETNKDLLKITNLKFKDKDNNTLITPIAYINTRTGKIFGKDVNINLNNSGLNSSNEPRMKGNSVVSTNEKTEITKGVFTTCKRRDGCPPWELSAEKITHDKKNKTINYKNSILKVYDIPIMYFPTFFHPDPTVKRRSGFLIPTIKNSQNSTNYLNTPYFLAIAENKDATFSPRLYADEKLLIQTEYREVNSKSNHIADFSFLAEKDESLKNHFFYKFNKNLDFVNFEDSKIDLKIQNTSNDNYLKINKLNSKIINDKDVLENSLNLNLYSNDMSIDFETTMYENLGESNNDKFEYIFPKVNLIKRFDNKTSLNGDFSFRSNNLIRNYNTNVLEKTNINDLIFTSYPKITGMGFYNNYEFLIKNSNSDSQNSANFKQDANVYLSGLFQYNSSLPLIKDNQNYEKIFKPKLSLKFAPNHSKDKRNATTRIDVDNIYSLSRAAGHDTIEGGISLSYGSDYSIIKKANSNEIFNLKLANNLRFEENEDLPTNNQIGQKTSNFFGEVAYSPNDFITTKYNASIKNNLSDINYENLITEIKINNFVTSFDYLNENNISDENSYLSNKTSLILNDSNNLSFSTRKNKTLDLTEYYKLMYQYKNDCLSASIEYNKEYYSDKDLKPDESIFFRLTIIPFGEATSPTILN